MPTCAFCQKKIESEEKPGRSESCPHCNRDLHCCYQCRFYDANAHHECREPQADYVAEKDKANFCDYFAFDPQIKAKIEDQAAARAKLEALFKKRENKK